MAESYPVRAAILPVMVAGAILIWRGRRHVAGRLLILIGCLHMLGIWVGRDAVRRIAAGGFVNQVDSAVGRIPAKAAQELVFWFLLWGPCVILLGQLLIAMEEKGLRAPAWLGWELVAVNALAALLMPAGGFWWTLLPAWLIIRQAHAGGHIFKKGS